jgi:predicted nucleotidyltransferase
MTNPKENTYIREHHRKAIDVLAARMQQDPEVLAVIIGGSVAKGVAREDSDVDCYLVISDSAFKVRKQLDELAYYSKEECDYPGGYIDGKRINYAFIQAAAERGSEPTRASFEGAFVAFTRIPELSELVSQIPVFPEAQREKNLKDFYAQVLLYGHYFSDRALTLNNTYLLTHSVSQIALFAGRLLLAYNRILFPCHKSLAQTLERASEMPDRYMELQQAMLTNPTKETISDFIECVSAFQQWGLTMKQAVSRFIENNEWNWLEGEPPISDR